MEDASSAQIVGHISFYFDRSTADQKFYKTSDL